MITDDMLKRSAETANQALLDGLHEDSGAHRFSDTFQKNMKKLVRRAKHPILYQVMRGIACMVLVALLIGGVYIGVNIDAGRSLHQWVAACSDLLMGLGE